MESQMMKALLLRAVWPYVTDRMLCGPRDVVSAGDKERLLAAASKDYQQHTPSYDSIVPLNGESPVPLHGDIGLHWALYDNIDAASPLENWLDLECNMISKYAKDPINQLAMVLEWKQTALPELSRACEAYLQSFYPDVDFGVSFNLDEQNGNVDEEFPHPLMEDMLILDQIIFRYAVTDDKTLDEARELYKSYQQKKEEIPVAEEAPEQEHAAIGLMGLGPWVRADGKDDGNAPPLQMIMERLDKMQAQLDQMLNTST